MSEQSKKERLIKEIETSQPELLEGYAIHKLLDPKGMSYKDLRKLVGWDK